jgi:hypothetical protein
MPFNIAQDRLVRKEVALGVVREQVPPTNHIGLQVLAPWLEVQSDDVIFDYAKGLTDGLAPARAEDAESELAQKDDTFVGQGRAAIIDWALRDHYSASDVTRYREALLIAEATRDTLSLPLTAGAMTEGFQNKQERDRTLRSRKLYNRIEWMLMQALETGGIVYNDGKIKFTVTYGRPGGQQDQAPPGGTWNNTTSDPIGDLLAMQQTMYDTYGVRITRAITSRKVLNSVLNSDRFAARTGLAVAAGGTTIDPNYLIDGWGPAAAVSILERATGIRFIEYDSVYRTRPVGSNTVTNNRFLSQNKIFFLPDEGDIAEFDDTEIGFAKTLTSPHPEGNWQPGFYEWEIETRDPWGYDVGTGVKAFPVFLHLDKTYTMTVLP